jgi:hypothetical protein
MSPILDLSHIFLIIRLGLQVLEKNTIEVKHLPCGVHIGDVNLYHWVRWHPPGFSIYTDYISFCVFYSLVVRPHPDGGW